MEIRRPVIYCTSPAPVGQCGGAEPDPDVRFSGLPALMALISVGGVIK